MTAEVFIRRTDREVEGSTSTYQSLTWQHARNDVERWTLVTRDADDAEALTPVVNSAGNVTAPKGVVIRNGGVTIGSGWCDGLPDVRHDADGTEWTFSGWGDTVLMSDALVWPSPANAITSQAAHRVITATRSNMIRILYIENVANRLNIPGAVGGSDVGIGDVRTRRIRFAGLLDISQAIAGRTVNFQVRQRDTDNALFLNQWSPPDKRLDVQFTSETGTVQSWGYTVTPAEATRVIIAAGGELENRGLRLYVNTAEESQWGGTRRIERFKDRRDLDITDPEPGDDWLAEAAEDAADFLEENRSRATFTIDARGFGLSYGPDYMVGDLVRAYVRQDANGQPVGLVDDLLEEATVTWDSTGERADLRIGSAEQGPTTGSVAAFAAAMAAQDRALRLAMRRIQSLERNL